MPLAQQYIGISEPNFAARNELLNDICYTKVFVPSPFSLEDDKSCSIDYFDSFGPFLSQVADSLRQGHQAMVFVHSRKDTVKTANKLVCHFGSFI